MALMALLLEPYLDKPVDLAKTIRIILVHDLGEIYTSDFPAFKKQPPGKSQLERKALNKLTKSLPSSLQTEVFKLWEEYEQASTYEAKFAKALDKLEVLLQHNEADIKTLRKAEITFNFVHGLEQTEYDSFLKEFRQLVKHDTLLHYKKAGSTGDYIPICPNSFNLVEGGGFGNSQLTF